MKKYRYLKNFTYLLSLLLLIISCDNSNNINIEPDDDGLPRVDKSITNEETFFDLTIVDNSAYIQTGDNVFEEVDSTFTKFLQSSSQDIETNWDPDLGIITFSSENPGSSPYPTVSILYDLTSGEPVNVADATYAYIVTEVGISLQDVLIGTADELNARTYIYPYLLNQAVPRVYVIEVGTNYMYGTIRGQVVKRIREQGKFTGELILAEFVCNFRICTAC